MMMMMGIDRWMGISKIKNLMGKSKQGGVGWAGVRRIGFL